MLALVWRQLRRAPGRTLLTLAGVVIAVIGLVGLSTIVDGVRRAWVEGLDQGGGDLLVHEFGAIDPFNGSLPLAAGVQIAALDGVTGVEPVVLRMAAIEPGDAQTLLIGIRARAPDWQSMRFTAGGPPSGGEPWQGVLGAALADATELAPGDRFTVLFQDFTVAGIAQTGSHLGDYAVHMRLADAADLLFMEDATSLFAVAIDPRADADAVARTIEAAVPGVTAAPREALVSANQVIALLDALAWSVASIALISGIALVATTMMMSVIERRGEFALYKCVGWSNRRILALVMLEAGTIGLIAGSAGTVAGFAVAGMIGELEATRTFIDPQPALGMAILGPGAAVITSLIGAVLPAWRAIALDPATVLARSR